MLRNRLATPVAPQKLSPRRWTNETTRVVKNLLGFVCLAAVSIAKRMQKISWLRQVE